jgi:hypothetical protein
MQLRLGDKVVEVEMRNGVPTIQAMAEEIKYPDGRQDVIVHVPCFKIGGSVKEL